MGVREKLVELCEDVILSCKSSLCNDCEYNGIDYPKCMGVHFADHLIAHGVTVQGAGDNTVGSKWLSVKDRLPKEGAIVLCNTDSFFKVLQWVEEADMWFDQYRSYRKNYVTHWMPLPPAPKGE